MHPPNFERITLLFLCGAMLVLQGIMIAFMASCVLASPVLTEDKQWGANPDHQWGNNAQTKWRGTPKQKAEAPSSARIMPGAQGLPETKILLEHDDALPTQNRQQAMQMEAQYGHLPANEEAILSRQGYLSPGCHHGRRQRRRRASGRQSINRRHGCKYVSGRNQTAAYAFTT